MAVSVVHPLVADVILSAQGGWDGMVGFQQVSISKVQSAAWTLPILHAQKPGFLACHQGVVFQPLGPVNEIAVVGTRRALDLHEALDSGQFVGPDPALAIGRCVGSPVAARAAC